ncbi:hypothetical protein ScPMuIL_003060 [Solemya velum]
MHHLPTSQTCKVVISHDAAILSAEGSGKTEWLYEVKSLKYNSLVESGSKDGSQKGKKTLVDTNGYSYCVRNLDVLDGSQNT